MPSYIEYTTVTDLRSQYLGIKQGTEDALFLDRIRAASGMIDNVALRSFAPRVQTRNFDIPRGMAWSNILPPRAASTQVTTDESKLGGIYTAHINFDWDVLEVLTLKNGDGSIIPASAYWLYPANFTPKRSLKLKPTSGVAWLLDSSGNWEQVIALTAIYGAHEEYSVAWVDTGNTVSGAHTATTTALNFAGSGTMKPGSLYRIGNEIIYHVSGTTTPLTVVRGANGSTAQVFNGGETINLWTPTSQIRELAILGAWMLYKLRDNPTTETLVLPGGMSVVTPKDVSKYIKSKLTDFGNIRTGFG